MPLPRIESSQSAFREVRAARWLLPAALLALTPKCVLCVLAYVGVGAALGLSGPEWCRPAGGAGISWTTALAWVGTGLFCGAVAILLRGHCLRSGAKEYSRSSNR